MPIYHFLYARLIEVANTKASQVCPEGKEGLPPSATLCKKEYVIKGRGLSIPYLNRVAVAAHIRIETIIYNAFFCCGEFPLSKPVISKIKGIL